MTMAGKYQNGYKPDKEGNKDAVFGGGKWKQRRHQLDYLEEHEAEIIADAQSDMGILAIAHKHRLGVAPLRKWLEDGGIIDPPAPPVNISKTIERPAVPSFRLKEGEWYEMREARDEARFARVQVVFQGAVPGRTPDGKHYLFKSRHGSRYAYTCYQLKDALCGVWG
jgi:hypothetical protein